MQRISVIGSSSGAGKTTFGRRLAERLGLPFIELDAIHWGAGWSSPSPELFQANVLKELPAGGWVVDGNYGALGGLVWDRADTLVLLDIPFGVSVWRILTRTLRRIRTGEELWAGTGNRETIRRAFFDRDSLLLYALTTYRRRKRRWQEHLRTGRWAHLEVHRFRSNAEADRWLDSLTRSAIGVAGPACDADLVADPKAIVRRGFDLVSRAYRADDAGEGQYAVWLDTLEERVRPGAKILDLGCGCGVPVARRLARRYDVTGVDLSPVQISRARELVPEATFVCADMAAVTFPDESFAAVACFYALIHLPLAEQPALLRAARGWLRPGGVLMATVGHGEWTGIEKDWLGVPGGDMWWSHADTETYRRWLHKAGFVIELEAFVPEGKGGHTFILATRQ